MAKEWAKGFYNSKQWKQCRDSYIMERCGIDGGLCEICHTEVGYIVHHLETLTPGTINDPYTALNHDLLQYVCHNCHNKVEHFEKNFVGNQYIFDEDGQISPLKSKKNSKILDREVTFV